VGSALPADGMRPVTRADCTHDSTTEQMHGFGAVEPTSAVAEAGQHPEKCIEPTRSPRFERSDPRNGLTAELIDEGVVFDREWDVSSRALAHKSISYLLRNRTPQATCSGRNASHHKKVDAREAGDREIQGERVERRTEISR
jgi:hypothetical protein